MTADYYLKLAPPEAAYDEGRGCLRIVASLEVADRDDEVVDVASVVLDQYAANPVVLAVHDQKRWPVGRAVRTWAGEFKGRPALLQDWEFADSEEGRQVESLYRQGVLRGASIGFTPGRVVRVPAAEARRLYGVDRPLNRHVGATLMEVSAVPVPACPGALALDWLDAPAAAAFVGRSAAGIVTKSFAPFLRATPPATLTPTPTEAAVSQTDATKAMSTTDDTAGGSTTAAGDGDEIKTAFRGAFHKAADALFDAAHDKPDEHKGHWKAMKACHKSYVRHCKGVADTADDDADADDTETAEPDADAEKMLAAIETGFRELTEKTAAQAAEIGTLKAQVAALETQAAVIPDVVKTLDALSQ